MRVNVYAEEMTDRIEIIEKETPDGKFTGLRLYLELPATVDGKQVQGPFMHRPGDDDSAAVTFWGKRDLRDVLRKALARLDAHYERSAQSRAADAVRGKEGGAAWESGVKAANLARMALETVPDQAKISDAYDEITLDDGRVIVIHVRVVESDDTPDPDDFGAGGHL